MRKVLLVVAIAMLALFASCNQAEESKRGDTSLKVAETPRAGAAKSAPKAETTDDASNEDSELVAAAQTLKEEAAADTEAADAVQDTGRVTAELSESLMQAIVDSGPEYGLQFPDGPYSYEVLNAQGEPEEFPVKLVASYELMQRRDSGEPLEGLDVTALAADILTRYQRDELDLRAINEHFLPPGMVPPTEGEEQPELDLEQLIIARAPNFGITYDPLLKSLTSPDFPADGIPVSRVTQKLEQALDSQPDVQREDAVDQFLQGLTQVAANVVAGSGSISATGAETVELTEEMKQQLSRQNDGKEMSAPEQFANRPRKLGHPPIVYGEWKSLEEFNVRNEDNVVKHSNDYHEHIFFWYDGHATMHLVRDGENAFTDEYAEYTYDPQTGLVVLYDDAGQEAARMTAWAYENDWRTLYLQREGSSRRTMLGKWGRAGSPQYEEELEDTRRTYEEFEEFMARDLEEKLNNR